MRQVGVSMHGGVVEVEKSAAIWPDVIARGLGFESEIAKTPGFLGGSAIFRLVFLCQQTLILTCTTLDGRTL